MASTNFPSNQGNQYRHGGQSKQGHPANGGNYSIPGGEQNDQGRNSGKELTQSKLGNKSFFKFRSSQSVNQSGDGWQQQWELANDERNKFLEENLRLKQKLEDERRNNQRIERKADSLQRHIDNMELLFGPQASDDRIADRFEMLMGRIKTWSLKFTADKPTSTPFEPTEDKLDIYHQVNARCRTWNGLQVVMQDDKRRRVFARGLVAYVLSSTIFRAHDAMSPEVRILEPKDSHGYLGQDFWLEEPLRRYVYGLESKLYGQDSKVGYRELNDWRALTVELLSRSRVEKPTIPADTDAHLKHLEAFVMELMEPWAAPITGDSRDDFENLSDILKEAVEVSNYIRSQRPCWSVRFPRTYIPTAAEIAAKKTIWHPYDPYTMRDRQFDDFKGDWGKLRKYFVEFVVSPGLYKRGSLEGDHFDTESIVKKAEVVVWNDGY